MADVAHAAGVSAMTVSYTYAQPARVSEEAASKVRAAAEKLGYPGPHPGARSLRRGRTGCLGVLLGEHLAYAFADPQAARFLAGVAEVCADRGVALTLVPVTGRDDDSERVREAAVDGFVVWTTADDDPVLDAVVARGLPAVVHGGPRRADLPTVSIDDRAAALAVARAAFARAKRPAVLSFPLDRAREGMLLAGPDVDRATFSVTRHRLQGFRDAWLESGGPWSDVQVAVCSKNDASVGAAHTSILIAGRDGPDAIAAMSDELALGALQAATHADRRVPDTLAITGWDDSAAAANSHLTTVRQSLHDQGAHCARIALGEQALPELHRVEWQVIRRSTTRPQS